MWCIWRLMLGCGGVDFLSEEWQDMFGHAVAECERLGIDITLGVYGCTGSGSLGWKRAINAPPSELFDGSFRKRATDNYIAQAES